ncbi:Sec-independent protein translocase protein TatC [Actinoplanes lobatus]|uniref:Sec-independent protein translocase protein TatC n=1 Tax=Actinoplanes lobatus TaxID=113568 RepID=A0A7W7HQ57_9ACTN|nr:twin-arginine translocase subunit TatC [Actinoplanes lobatus]MBB4754629.1 sec-independent protein translocase protein TatC [Actinoplanes lobatus]GGN66619.1 Sec-independent protein translocase protein TatC [Actinoplanes lobatus]GIE42519.1 Sec-independent protein translocase protein TatC [Actinoplanes lobatus]
MDLSLRKNKGPSKFQQAADGSMTLIEHVRELRNRLFWASLGIVVGLIVGFILANWAFDVLSGPYCALDTSWVLNAQGEKQCMFLTLGATDSLIIRLKIALWLGLIIGAPVWLYQLWAFIAPGLHRHERKWAYVFVAIAAPLFLGGAVLAYLVVEHSLAFIMEAGVLQESQQLEVTAYIGFVTTMILLFGVAFEFPLVLLMLNFTGVVSARRLLSWWRTVVFLSFAFAAIATPDPGPFGMTLLAACMSLLYFIAVGVAFLYDRRKGRGREIYAGLDDDAISPLEEERVPVGASDPIESPTSIDAPAPVEKPMPIERRFDDMT